MKKMMSKFIERAGNSLSAIKARIKTAFQAASDYIRIKWYGEEKLLQSAVRANDLNEVNRLLADPRILAVAAADNNRALSFSASLKTPDIANRLLEIPAIFDAVTFDSSTSNRLWFLQWAVSSGFITTVKKLLTSKDMIDQLEQPVRETNKLVYMNMTLMAAVNPKLGPPVQKEMLNSLLRSVSTEAREKTYDFIYLCCEIDGYRKVREAVCAVLGPRPMIIDAAGKERFLTYTKPDNTNKSTIVDPTSSQQIQNQTRALDSPKLKNKKTFE